MNNIFKHSGAKTAYFKIKILKKNIDITVKDNGIGFKFENINDENTGLGWKGILEKINILNGKINVLTNASSGTKIKILIPLK